MKSMWTLALLMLIGCGGAPKVTKAPPKAPALAADIQAAAAPGYQKKDAVVTFAVFGGPIDDAEQRVRKALATPSVPGFVKGPPMLPAVGTHAVKTLPIRIEALAQGPHAKAIEAASHATIVHSVGPPGADSARLRWAALAALALAEDGIVVDMSNRVSRDAKAFADWVKAADFLQTQIKIAAFKENPATVMFHTEGMAKLGLPDVEMGGVPIKTAKLAYAGFQATVQEVIERGWVGVGDTLKMSKLAACERPPVAITHECVRLVKLN
jgi:hypothetical protein